MAGVGTTVVRPPKDCIGLVHEAVGIGWECLWIQHKFLDKVPALFRKCPAPIEKSQSLRQCGSAGPGLHRASQSSILGTPPEKQGLLICG